MAVVTEPYQLLKHLYILYAEFYHDTSSTVYLVEGQKPTVIDPGSEEVFSTVTASLAMRGYEWSDVQVVATHEHSDHISGFTNILSLHPDADIYLHEDGIEAVITGDPYQTCADAYEKIFTPFPPERCKPLVDGQYLPIGDVQATVISLPGHTPGSIGLLLKIDGLNVLLAGDAIDGCMRPYVGSNEHFLRLAREQQIKSVEKLVDTPIDWILTGHEDYGHLPHVPQFLDLNLSIFRQGFARARDIVHYNNAKRPFCAVAYNALG